MTDYKTPPNDETLEKFVLGSIIMDSVYLKKLGFLDSDVFYQPNHKTIFECCIALSMKGKSIDMITLVSELRDTNKLDTIGGAAYIAKLISNVGSGARVVEYSAILFQLYMKRELIRVSRESIDKCYSGEDISTIIETNQLTYSTMLKKTIKNEPQQLHEIGERRLKEIELISQEKGLLGVTSGFSNIDGLTSGWQKSDLIICGARPSMGKTAVSIEFLKNAAIDGKNVLMFSCEMSGGQVYDRFASYDSHVENGKIRTGKLNESEWAKLEQTQTKFQGCNIFIDETSGIEISELKSKAMDLYEKYGIDLIVVDYLQLVRSKAYKNAREQEISHVSRELKALAKDLQVPVIALSQLNRKVEERADKTPMMSDIRESGAIEQDADVIFFLHRPEYYGSEDYDHKNLIELIFCKHRNGVIGKSEIYKNDTWTNFASTQDFEQKMIQSMPDTPIKDDLTADNSFDPPF